MVTEDQVKAKELGERLGKLFQVLMNKSFLNPEVREEIEEILGRLSFGKGVLPRDVYKALEDNTEDLIKAVIKDVFGRLMSNLSGDERLRLEVKIDQAIESEITRLIR